MCMHRKTCMVVSHHMSHRHHHVGRLLACLHLLSLHLRCLLVLLHPHAPRHLEMELGGLSALGIGVSKGSLGLRTEVVVSETVFPAHTHTHTHTHKGGGG
jgi:hypothetical protein